MITTSILRFIKNNHAMINCPVNSSDVKEDRLHGYIDHG